MADFDDVFNSIVNTPGTPANSFELLLDVKPAGGGGFVNIPDITDLAPVETPKNRNRETYASKGVDANNKYAASMQTTVNIEIVRDDAGQWQPELVDLMVAARSKGAANRRLYRVYDALGADYAFEATGAISTTFNGTDWDSAKWVTVTFAAYREVEWVTNPTADGTIPVITAALPVDAVATETLTLTGDRFTGATGVTIGGTAGTSLQVLNDGLLSFVIPATKDAGDPIIVTTPDGVSAAFTNPA